MDGTIHVTVKLFQSTIDHRTVALAEFKHDFMWSSSSIAAESCMKNMWSGCDYCMYMGYGHSSPSVEGTYANSQYLTITLAL